MTHTASRMGAAVLSTALLTGTALVSSAQATELRYAMGFPPESDSDVAAQSYAEAVENYSDGSLSINVFAMSLLNFQETSAGIRDGMADIGYLLAPYFVSEYPHYNMLAESSMLLEVLEDDHQQAHMAYVGAMSEFTFHHCPECLDEFEQQNQVFTGSAGSTRYGLACDDPVRDLDDIEGKRLRAGGSHWSRWSEHVGASPVTMSANEVFEALSQGVVDCVIISAPEFTNLGLIDAVTDVTMAVPGGIFAGTATTNVNADTWRGLEEDQRQALLRAATIMSAEIPTIYRDREEEVMDELRNRGIGIHDPDPELIETTHAFIEEDMETITQYYGEEYGVERAEEMIEEFEELLEVWLDRVRDVETSEELAALYWEKAFSRVDPSTHGM